MKNQVIHKTVASALVPLLILAFVPVPSLSADPEPITSATGVLAPTVSVDQAGSTQSSTDSPQEPTSQFLGSETVVSAAVLAITPFEVSASTNADNPNVRRDLMISVKEDGSATVTWFGRTLSGIFRPDEQGNTARLVIVTSAGATKGTWSFAFEMVDGKYILSTAKSESRTTASWGETHIVSLYHLTPDGSTRSFEHTRDVVAQDPTKNSSYHLLATLTYIKIGGVERVTSTIQDIEATNFLDLLDPFKRTFKNYSQHRERYRAYDLSGYRSAYGLVEETIRDGVLTGYIQANVSDRLTNSGTSFMENYYADTGIKDRVNSMETLLGELNANAHTKIVGYPGFQIEYARNSAGQWVPRRTVADFGTINPRYYIIQGAPDVLSGETDDILIKNGQLVNGYSVRFGRYDRPDFSNDPKAVQWIFVGYGLIFEKGNEVKVVDFPREKLVKLGGVLYSIEVDATGLVHLKDVLRSLIDSNGDGSITSMEVEAFGSQANGLIGASMEEVDPRLFRVLDLDEDGEITVLDIFNLAGKLGSGLIAVPV